MSNLYNVSSSPHVRSKLSTGTVMYDVILALVPATVVGIWNFGFHAFLVILMSITGAVLTEYVFDYIAKKPMTIMDGSAVVTGLLLALCLPASVPLYVPYIGSVFAILIVKCLFGGLGKNFMNPALAGRCFLLISFGTTMTKYAVDGVTGPTPLAKFGSGEAVSVLNMFLGSTNGVIGCSIMGLVIGGIYLIATKGITWEIPTATLVSFLLFIAIFGGNGFTPSFLLTHLFGGGIVMAAFFMATDPVTSPVTSNGQLVYGALVGILSGLFRLYGSSADSVSYAVIISNMIVPMIDEFIPSLPYAYRKQRGKFTVPSQAIALCVITIGAGVLLSGVFTMTKDTIEEQKMAANVASYQEVLPEAASFGHDDAITAKIEELGGEVYGTDFGKVYINDVIVGKDSSDAVVGYVFSVTTKDGFDGAITLSAGIKTDGTLNGIAFTELNETAGMGMRAAEPAFKDQFSGVNVSRFTLNKAGGSTAAEEIDSISGASITSGAVVNAVNAALDFFANNIQ